MNDEAFDKDLDELDHRIEQLRRFSYDARHYRYASLDDRSDASLQLRSINDILIRLGSK